MISICVAVDGTTYGIHQVIITNGYYGSCGHHSRNDSGYGGSALGESTPLLSRARVERYLNCRIFSLGILFIGGITIGGYLLYKQSTIHFQLSVMSGRCNRI